MSPRARRSLVVSAGVLVAWYLAVLLLWAVQPLSDSVPIGIDYSPTALVPPKPAKQISEAVDCNSLFAGDARDDVALPELPVQPEGFDSLQYSRSACSAVQRDARIVFGLNTLFVVLALTALAVLAKRLVSHPQPPPIVSTIGTATTA